MSWGTQTLYCCTGPVRPTPVCPLTLDATLGSLDVRLPESSLGFLLLCLLSPLGLSQGGGQSRSGE